MAIINLTRYGFVRYPSEDFKDDGNRFTVYYYDPQNIGDKRFKASKCVYNGDIYFSVGYYDNETGKSTYFDDLNGVSNEYAAAHIEELTNKIDAFKAKLDAGEIKPIELSDEEIQAIKDKTKQFMSSSNMSYNRALDAAYKELGIDSYSLRRELRNRINKEVESEVRNAREDNPVVVRVLAKKLLQEVMKAIRGTPGSYNSRGRWMQGDAPKSLEDALKINSMISTYSIDSESKELIDAGVAEDTIIRLSDLTDANQKRIRSWVKHKIETLYDFDSYVAQEAEDNLEENFKGPSYIVKIGEADNISYDTRKKAFSTLKSAETFFKKESENLILDTIKNNNLNDDEAADYREEVEDTRGQARGCYDYLSDPDGEWYIRLDMIDKHIKEEKIKKYSKEELQGIELQDYYDTWSAFDELKVGDKTYYILENDEYGDETCSLVVSEDLKEIYETYDDIETCLKDEGIL